MCELAVEHTSTWLMVDPWEAGQPEYQRTAVVLDHFDEMLNGKDGEGGVEMRDGTRRKYKVMLLAGGDLIESFGEPGVWSEPDVSHQASSRQCYAEGREKLTLVLAVAHHSRSIRLSDRREGWVRRLGVLAFARHPLPSSVGGPRHSVINRRILLTLPRLMTQT
jgi:nicotinic acid mononucleotide adenylyltransferase